MTLTEAVGADPSPGIAIDSQRNAPLPEKLTMSIEALIDRAMKNRPDFMAQTLRIRSAEARIRAAKAEYRPQIALSGSVAQTSVWPTADYCRHGPASEPTCSAALGIKWRIFDGGVRKNELTTKDDETTREVWTAYIAFRTALRKHDAAVALLESAHASYSASLDAYECGVKNLVDVVTAEEQLAKARLSSVSVRSELLIEAVNLEFATGNLLRNQPPATTLRPQEGHQRFRPDRNCPHPVRKYGRHLRTIDFTELLECNRSIAADLIGLDGAAQVGLPAPLARQDKARDYFPVFTGRTIPASV